MHKGFIDKNRRLFNLRQLQVENVLPEHFAQYYPKFISLLEKYYEWQEQLNSTELINHLFAARDINETDISLLSYIEDELLLGDAYFEGFGATDVEKRAAANFSNILFRSKGTKFAIEWFFRSFYGLDAEVLYPKENIFKVGETGSLIGPDSNRFLTDDKLYQTYALLVRVGIPISKWKDVFKLFVHPAGMYLGGEVLITDVANIVVSLPEFDSSVSARTNVDYSMTVLPSIASNEGTVYTATVSGTNVLNGVDALYYYIEHLSTSDSDFIGVVPDSNNPSYFAIDNSIGSFNIQTRLDSDATESTESFKIFIKDQYGTVYDSAEKSIVNVDPTYTLTSTATEWPEGSEIVVTINATNVPAQNSTVYWYIDRPGVTYITTDDFDPTVPFTSGDAIAVNVVNGVGTITLYPSFGDASDQATEDFDVVITNAVGSAARYDTLTLTIVDVTLDVTVTVNDIVEGEDIVATVTVNNSSLIGDTFDWSITGGDARLDNTTGTFVMNSLSQNVTLTGTTASALYQGATTVSVNVNKSVLISGDDTFDITDQTTLYTLSSDVPTAGEGDTVTFSVGGSNIPDGTYYFAINHGTTDDADFTVAPPTSTRQSITVTNNVGGTSPSFTFASNGDVTSESFTAELYTASTGGSPIATLPYTITGTGVSYTLTPSSPVSYDEGNIIFAQLTGTGFANGTYYYWVEPTSGSSITASDFVNGSSFTGSNRGSFSVASQQGDISITIANDLAIEGSETFVIKVSESPTGGAVATSAVITIADTSLPTYTISANNIVEGQEFLVEIDAAISGSETVYLVITGDAASKFTITQKTAVVTSGVPFNVSFGNTTVDSSFESNPTGTISLRRGSYAGTLLASDTFTVNDQSATYTLTANDTTPDEGTTVSFTVGGSGIQDGNYYYYIKNSMISTQTISTVTSGDFFIPLDSTTGLTIGMETNAIGIPGTITNVASNGVTMSSAVTASSIGNGSTLYFALPAVFDDFANSPNGVVSVTNSSGAFNVNISTNTDASNDTYTFALYDAPYEGTELATETITIQDTTTGFVEIDTSTTTISDVSFNTTSYTEIEFLSNGNIRASGNLSPGGNDIVIGTWVTGSFNASDYSIVATVSSQNNGQLVGSFGTTLVLNSTRTFAFYEDPPFTNGNNSASVNISFAITGPGTGNNDSQTFFFQVDANRFDGGGGDFER